MKSVTSWTPSQPEPRHNLVACRCWQASVWQTNAMQRLQPSTAQHKFANLGVHRDHWVHRCWRKPSRCSFPHGNWKGFRPSVKDGFRSFLFVVTACRNGREASLPEKGATEAPSCQKGGNMWRHWYGLAQAWGSTTYDGLWGRSYLGVGRRAASRTWQKLCQREDTGLPWGKPYHGRIHIWDYPKENQALTDS